MAVTVGPEVVLVTPQLPRGTREGCMYHSPHPFLFLLLHILVSMERDADLGHFSQVSAFALELWAQTGQNLWNEYLSIELC